MKTEVIRIDPIHPEPSAIKRAAAIIKNGGLVAFPTETVYGLGADAGNKLAVSKIYMAKGRPSDNPLIVHISRKEDLFGIIHDPPGYLQALVDSFWPGPLSVVAAKRKGVEIHCGGGLGTIAVRLPSSPAALALIEASGAFVCAPSANSSTKPSPTNAEHVLADLDGKIDLVLDGGQVSLGLESTVVDATGPFPSILRPGFVTREMIEARIGPLYEPVGSASGKPKAPGMKYAHYAPKAQVVLVTGPAQGVAQMIRSLSMDCPKKSAVLATSQNLSAYGGLAALDAGDRGNPSSIGANLFSLLRKFDEMGVEVVFAEGIDEAGVGEAVMNRLKKASAGRIVEVGV
jgi:L-threonylcarbamoyladenylate synthase